MKSLSLTAEYANQCFCYDQATGVLTWRSRPRNHFSTERGWNCFNAQRAGKAVTSVNRNGYVSVGINGVNYLAHRIVWLMTTGFWPENDIDHINGIRDDNRMSNIRAVDRSTNARNVKRRRTNNSGVTGVSWVTRDKLWLVQTAGNS